jgi:hypothetical protein
MSTARYQRVGALLRTLNFSLVLASAGLGLGYLGCSISSPAAPVPTLLPPTIVTQPVSQTVIAGQAVTFSVTPAGAEALTYAWAKNGTAIPGATSSSYSFTAAAGDSGSYTVTVTNGGGSTTSSVATLTVNPTFTVAAPANQTALDGAAATFSVTGSGLPPYTYQWTRGTVSILNATASSFTTGALVYGTDNGAQFACVVTDSLNRSVTSGSATLTVTPIAPTFTSGPASQAILVGQPVTFSATPAGTLPFTYQWAKNGTSIPAATSNPYTFTTASGDAGTYTVTVTGPGGAKTSTSATLTVNPLFALTNPANQTANDGSTATFSITASGSAPIAYQWYRGTTLITGANASSYTTNALVYANDNGVQFSCKATDSLNRSNTSNAATLTVSPLAPTITAAPVPVTVAQGSSATFSVVANGTAPLSYQWYQGSTAVSGATSATWTFTSPMVAVDNGTLIKVVVSNGFNPAATSAQVLLVVQNGPNAPLITAQPQSVALMPPNGNTFSVTATGAGLSYAWKAVDSNTVLGTGSTYTVAATDLHNLANQYQVTVSNNEGTVDSQPALLAVSAPTAVYAGDPVFPGNSNFSIWPSFSCVLPADPTGSFRIGYDLGKLAPVWSAACFFPYIQPWTYARSDYPTDTRIVGSPDTSAYTNTGYSRGHQTAFAALRNVYGVDAASSTMYMSNMAPQVQDFNAGAWEDLESIGQVTLPAAFGRVWVYTGPIYSTPLVLPIGPRNLPVPTAYYKVMVRETAPGNPKVLALVLPHSTTVRIPAIPFDKADLWKFVTTVDRVQALTGLTFFPTPSTPLPPTFTSVVDVRGWGATLEQGPAVPNVHIIDPSWDSTFTHVHNTTAAKTTISTAAGVAGSPINFAAQATPGTDPIATTSWDFGDGQSDTALVTQHTYAGTGTFNVTFTATDTTNHSSSLTRYITVVSASPTNPVLPAITDLSMVAGTPGTKVFYVSDTHYLAGTITFTATSSDPTVLVNNLTVNNLNGTCSLALSPIAAGTVIVTVTATNGAGLSTIRTFTVTVAAAPPPASNTFTEGFNANLKTGYAVGTITLPSGSWILNDALIGNLANDVKAGTYSIRMQNKTAGTASGKVTQNFDWAAGAKTFTFSYARYGSDAAGSLSVWYSLDHGSTWVSAGADITDATTLSFKTATYTLNLNQPIRFEIRRSDTLATKMNLDDLCVTGY